MTARGHHFLPQCYLKGFVHDREKPRVFVVDSPRRESFTTNTLNVAKRRDFNAVQVEGVEPDAMENAFAKFEGVLAPALARIAETRSLANEEDRILLLNFMAMTAVKNPRRRETFRQFTDDVSKKVMEMATATPERWAAQVKGATAAGYMTSTEGVDYAGMRDFVERGEYDIQLETGYHLQMEMKVFDKILDVLVARKWTVLRVPDDRTGFITSDHPFCLLWTDATGMSPMFPPGLAMTGTQIIFPVTNSVAVIGTFEGNDVELEVDDPIIAALNSMIILNTERQTYARDDDFPYQMSHHPEIMRGRDLLADHKFGVRA